MSNPTPSTIDALLTERIAEVVPEILKCTKSLYVCGSIPCVNPEHRRPIGLADVLRATAKRPIPIIVWSDGYIGEHSGAVYCKWNLSLSLLEQDYKTKVQLLELLKL